MDNIASHVMLSHQLMVTIWSHIIGIFYRTSNLPFTVAGWRRQECVDICWLAVSARMLNLWFHLWNLQNLAQFFKVHYLWTTNTQVWITIYVKDDFFSQCCIKILIYILHDGWSWGYMSVMNIINMVTFVLCHKSINCCFVTENHFKNTTNAWNQHIQTKTNSHTRIMVEIRGRVLETTVQYSLCLCLYAGKSHFQTSV